MIRHFLRPIRSVSLLPMIISAAIVSRNNVMAVCTPCTVVPRSFEMLLIATFMFEPAKLHTNCAAASGTSIRWGEMETFRSLTRSRSETSHALRRFEPPVADRLHELVVVLLIAVGITLGEVGDRPLELVALAEIRGDRDRISRARVRACERPRARPPVERQLRDAVGLHLGGALHVAELPPVEVPRDVESLRPAEEDVARRLHHPLTLDDSLSVVTVATLRQVILQDRRRRLLDLEEQGVLLVTPLEQHDERACPHAPDADDLASHVDDLEPLEEQ